MPQNNSRKRQLAPERILRTAVELADAHGVEALTMRKVADALNTGAMSLYNHVSGKDDMLVGMVERVASEIQLPASGEDWKAMLRAGASAAHVVLLRHPWACMEWSRRMPGPHRLRYMDWILGVLTEAGFSSDLVYHGYHAVLMHVVGFTLQELAYAEVLGEDVKQVASEFLKGPAAAYPHLAEHIQAHLHDTHEDEFEFVLNLILDGLECAARR